MSFPTNSTDERLAEIVESLLAECQAGQQPNLEQAISDHPELADELREVWGAVMIADAVAARTESHTPSTESDTFPAPLELPARFGDYELLEEIGRGGMGIVYRAQQISLGRTVALKLILPGRLASEDDLERFRVEAEAAAQLDHPGIVPLYEVGTHDGQPFFSMKYVAGTTLARKLLAGPLDPRESARILAQVARAIEFAHDQGVLHRDLKPANILIDVAGRAYVTDFGLAKRIEGGATLTQTGAVLGTPSYMAPEQAAGGRGTLGPACDVFSLGAVLYATLAGRPPFYAQTPMETMFMLLEQDPPLPHVFNPKANRDLELISLRCLQKPQELRYPTCGALADDLEAALRGDPIAARSGKFSHVIARMFRETHHAAVLENWGLLWMWHAAVLLAMCLITNWLHWRGNPWGGFRDSVYPYLALWGGGLMIWAPIFWAVRHRGGPVTFVERQIAHIWGGSVISVVLLFVVESALGMPVLTLSPVLGLISGMVFIAKAGILTGAFYVHSASLFATAIIMALMQRYGRPLGIEDLGISLFGVVSALTFFLPGLKYYRQARASR